LAPFVIGIQRKFVPFNHIFFESRRAWRDYLITSCILRNFFPCRQADFFNSLNKINHDFKRVLRENEEGITRLRWYSRNERGRGTTTYEQAIRNLHPTQETRRRIQEPTQEEIKLGIWANSVLSAGQKMMVNLIKPLSAVIGKLQKTPEGKVVRAGGDKKIIDKLTSVGRMFDTLPIMNRAKIVTDAYTS